MSSYGNYPNPQLCRDHGIYQLGMKDFCSLCTFKKTCDVKKKSRFEVRTWMYEIAVMALVLSTVNFIWANNPINWISTLAILITFNHAQIADRLQERQGKLDVKTVECYYKLNYLFAIKESLWIWAFILMGSYAAIVGSCLFFLYPFWRKYYRARIKPLPAKIPEKYPPVHTMK